MINSPNWKSSENSSRCTFIRQALLISRKEIQSWIGKKSVFTESKNCLCLFSHIFHTLWHEDGGFHPRALGLLKHLIHKMARDNQIVSDKRLTIGSAANMCHYRCPFRFCTSPTLILPTLATLLLLLLASFFLFLHAKKIVLHLRYFTH